MIDPHRLPRHALPSRYEVRLEPDLEAATFTGSVLIDVGVGESDPTVDGLVLKDNFSAYVDRKLFIHNLGHAAAAYHGHLAGKTYIWEAVAVEEIRQAARGAMWESARALIRQYPTEFNERNQSEQVEDLLRRFANRALGDTVFRVGRDLTRKLSSEDRLMGALRLVQSHGLEPEYIVRAIAAALSFKGVDESGEPFPDDVAFHERLAKAGVESILIDHCGLDATSDRATIDKIVGMTNDKL